MDMAGVLQAAGRSLKDPTATVRQLIARPFDSNTRAALLALVVLLSVLVLEASRFVFPSGVQNPVLMVSPFLLVLVLGVILVVMIFAFHFTGQVLGGKGRMADMMIAMTWWQAMAMAIQILQITALLAIPVLGAIISLVGFVWLMVALVIVVNEVHGYENRLKGIATVVLALFGAMFGLAMILTLIGVGGQGVMNV